MAIKIDEDNRVVVYENEPEEARSLFRNLQEGGGVQDVQINGTSIVDANGDADIPIASESAFGTVGLGDINTGITLNSANKLRIAPATASAIKSSSGAYVPLVPDTQHQSAFYGLAKAAGDTTQSSSDNAVGTYTEAAKKAIKEMLGIPSWVYSDYKLIYSEEIETSGELIINADLDGNPISLKSVFLLAECPDGQAPSSGIAINVYDNNVMQGTGYINIATSTANIKRGFCIIDARNGLWKTEMAAFGTSGLMTLQTYVKDIDVYGGSIDKIRLTGCIPGYTIKLYGL